MSKLNKQFITLADTNEWILPERRSEQTMIKATFFVALFSVVVNAVLVAGTWRSYHLQVALYSQVAQLQERVAALEAAATKQGKQQ